jgi:hypothetical protein
MYRYSENEKRALTDAIRNASDRLEGLFVGDNIRMLRVWEQQKRLHGSEADENDVNYFGVLADRLAEDMDGINGASFQYETTELIQMLDDYK